MSTVHLTNGNWNYAEQWEIIGWIGGKFPVPNASSGYHGLLKQWWDHYSANAKDWLLVSENNTVKDSFKELYPNSNFTTLEYYQSYYNKNFDINCDITNRAETDYYSELFDSIVCQATMEHLFDPVSALINMKNMLVSGGHVYIHTNTPAFPYHAYPRDYVRFFSDWFFDAENNIKGIQLKELYDAHGHIFACYQKV